jgi:hypothetical protein
MHRELLFARRDDVLFFTNNIGYIFIVRRLEKQSNPILSRSDSISNLEPNLKIHGPCGPNAHAGADLQAFLIFYFKPILLSDHKLTLLIYGDNIRTIIFSKKYVRVLYMSFYSYRVVFCAPIPTGPRTPDFGSCSMSYSL